MRSRQLMIFLYVGILYLSSWCHPGLSSVVWYNLTSSAAKAYLANLKSQIWLSFPFHLYLGWKILYHFYEKDVFCPLLSRTNTALDQEVQVFHFSIDHHFPELALKFCWIISDASSRLGYQCGATQTGEIHVVLWWNPCTHALNCKATGVFFYLIDGALFSYLQCCSKKSH